MVSYINFVFQINEDLSNNQQYTTNQKLLLITYYNYNYNYN